MRVYYTMDGTAFLLLLPFIILLRVMIWIVMALLIPGLILLIKFVLIWLIPKLYSLMERLFAWLWPKLWKGIRYISLVVYGYAKSIFNKTHPMSEPKR